MSLAPAPVQIYEAGSYCAEESVGYLMKRVLLSIAQQADKRLGEVDLTMAQWAPLMRMRQVGQVPVAELAQVFTLPWSAYVRLLVVKHCKTACKTFQISGVISVQKLPPWVV